MKRRASKTSMHPLVGLRVLNVMSRQWGVATGHLPANTTQPERITVKCDDGSFATWAVRDVLEVMDL